MLTALSYSTGSVLDGLGLLGVPEMRKQVSIFDGYFEGFYSLMVIGVSSQAEFANTPLVNCSSLHASSESSGENMATNSVLSLLSSSLL